MNDMKRNITAGLTSKDDKNACAYAERIVFCNSKMKKVAK